MMTSGPRLTAAITVPLGKLASMMATPVHLLRSGSTTSSSSPGEPVQHGGRLDVPAADEVEDRIAHGDVGTDRAVQQALAVDDRDVLVLADLGQGEPDAELLGQQAADDVVLVVPGGGHEGGIVHDAGVLQDLFVQGVAVNDQGPVQDRRAAQRLVGIALEQHHLGRVAFQQLGQLQAQVARRRR